MKNQFLTTALCCALTIPVFSQNVGINSDGNNPDPSAMLDVESTTKGMLIPRMTLAQRNLIASPASGLIIYQTNNTPGFYFYNGTNWIAVLSATNGWTTTGNAGTNPATNFIGTTNNQGLRFRTNNSDRFEIANNASTLRAFAGGSATAPTYSWSQSTNTGIFQPSVGVLGISTSGSERMRFGSGGAVSVNSTTAFASTVFNVFSAASDQAIAGQSNLGRAGYFQSTGTTGTTQTLISFQGSTQISGTAASIWGQSTSSSSGVFLASAPDNATTALTGQYTGGGDIDGAGVFGFSSGSANGPGWGYGVIGQGNYYGVYSDGDFGASGGKFFQIDHPTDPENKILRHACMESNEILTHYRGTIQMDASGSAIVQLPDYFESLNINFSYHLTPVGAPGPHLYISSEISNNQFEISGGQPGAKVSWMVEAERNDKYMQTHADRKIMEIDKKDYMKGKYLDPQSWGQPEERGVHFGELKTPLKSEKAETSTEE